MDSSLIAVIEFFSGVFQSTFECMPGRGCRIEWDTVAALASLLVGFFAWQTARRSSKIAERAVEIAANQHREMEIQRVAAGEVLAHLLVVEVGAVPATTAARRDIVRGLLATAQSTPGQAPALRADLTLALRSVFRENALASTEQALSRLHNLPDDLAQMLALLLGYNRLIQSSVDAIFARCSDDQEYSVVVYSRGLNDWTQLESMLNRFFGQSVECAGALRKFVGFPPASYNERGEIMDADAPQG